MITNPINHELVNNLENKKVLIIGDIILDHYQIGQVERISPEAPIPIVEIHHEQYKLGGAGNVARNIAALGGLPSLVSVYGNDNASNILSELLLKTKINPIIIADNSRPTTVKTRIMASQQQILRVDKESKMHTSPAIYKKLQEAICPLLDEHEIVIISDYGKGVITPIFLDWIMNNETKNKILIDPKNQNYDFYKNAFIMTPNRKEAAEMSKMNFNSQAEIIAAGKYLCKSKNLQNLLITLGADGMVLFCQSGEIIHIPTTAKKVFDVTGAGDTVIALLALCLSAQNSLLESCIVANYAAGIVVGQVGAEAVSPAELQSVLNSSQNSIQVWKD